MQSRQRCKQIFSKSWIVGACGSLLLAAGCSWAYQKNGGGEVIPLSESAEKELSVSGRQLAVVFAVDVNGNIQAFRSNRGKLVSVDFPIKDATVLDFRGISLLNLNPKTCWKTDGGDKHCLVY